MRMNRLLPPQNSPNRVMIRLRCPGGSHKLNGHLGSQQQKQQHQRCCPVQRRNKLVLLCHYDLRKSANNVEERRQRQLLPGTSAAERSLTQQQLRDAKATLVHQRAYTLCGASKGQLSHHLCLFLLTEQRSLISVDSAMLASRIATMADVLRITQPDAAELLVRNGALLDVLPLRLKSAAEALCIALGVSKDEALVMLATDTSLLDCPPLRLKQQLQELSALLQVHFDVLADMAAACPHFVKVEPPAVQIRWTSLQSLLQLSSTHLQSLLRQEPRLLMPSSQTLSQNHSATCQTLGISPETLNRWVFAAPLLLLVPAAQLQKRVDALVGLVVQEVDRLAIPDGTAAAAAGNSTSTTSAAAGHGDSTTVAVMPNAKHTDNNSSSSGGSSSSEWVSVVADPQQLIAYISKDPRVLLVKPHEIQPRLATIQQELCCPYNTLAWLLMSHPSYLAVEPGSVTAWMCDVGHLTQTSTAQAARLALCPQVFLTMSPEEVYTSLTNLGRTLQLKHPEALAIAAREPLLLQQHPALTAAALQQLVQLVPDRKLCHQLLLEVPELLLQGQQLKRCMLAAAAVLTLSCVQLAVALVRQPSLWWLLVPRHTWPATQQQQWQQQQHPQQQQQALSPAAATVVASMSALLNSGLRSPAVMQQVAVLQPLLLKLGSDVIRSHVLQLSEVCERCHEWQQQLQGVPPAVLGNCILKITVWKPRMMFLLDTGLARRVALHEIISMSRDEFERCFSTEYRQWKAAQKAQQHWESVQRWQQQWPQQQWQQQQHQWQQQSEEQHFEQQHVGRQRNNTQQHTDSLVNALEAFVAKQGNVGSNSSSDGGHGTCGAVCGVRNLVDIAGCQQGVNNSSSSSGNDNPVHTTLQQQQRQQPQLHPKNDVAAAAAEGEVFYYTSNGPEPWQAEKINSSGSSGSISYDGGAIESDSWDSGDSGDSCQQQQQQQEQQEEEGKRQPILLHLPFMRQADMQLLSVQHSAVQLYGSWEGSLVQPASTVAVQQQRLAEQH